MAARPLRIAILAIVAFAAGLILARALMPPRVAGPQMEHATALPGTRPLPVLALTNQDGALCAAAVAVRSNKAAPLLPLKRMRR